MCLYLAVLKSPRKTKKKIFWSIKLKQKVQKKQQFRIYKKSKFNNVEEYVKTFHSNVFQMYKTKTR